MKDDRIYLRHILECIGFIQSYTTGGRAEFFNDRKTQKATFRELQELAESTQRLSSPIKDTQPDIPWSDIAGFRNVLVHDYLGLNISRIWDIVERDLATLQTAIEAMMRELERE